MVGGGKMLTDRITTLVKEMIRPYIHEGDVVVDLTAGNGWDTLFLAQIVGEKGKVYSFDIQAVAIEHTRKLLYNNHANKQVVLIQAGHETIDTYVSEPIKGAMFNLGYLPGADLKIITKPESTCLALYKVLELLSIDGMVSIVSYFGHEGGMTEKLLLEDFLSKLDEKTFDVITIFYPNRQHNAPIMHFIRRKNGINGNAINVS